MTPYDVPSTEGRAALRALLTEHGAAKAAREAVGWYAPEREKDRAALREQEATNSLYSKAVDALPDLLALVEAQAKERDALRAWVVQSQGWLVMLASALRVRSDTGTAARVQALHDEGRALLGEG